MPADPVGLKSQLCAHAYTAATKTATVIIEPLLYCLSMQGEKMCLQTVGVNPRPKRKMQGQTSNVCRKHLLCFKHKKVSVEFGLEKKKKKTYLYNIKNVYFAFKY